jgi:hypothetical protein
LRPFKQLIQHYLNTLNGAAEVPAEAAVYNVIGGRSFDCSDSFVYISVKAAIEDCM